MRFRLIITFCALLLGGIFAAERLDPLPAEQAFRLSTKTKGNELIVRFTMPEAIYLYQDKILLTTQNPNITLENIYFPEAKTHEDPFFGKTSVYYDDVRIKATVNGSGKWDLIVLYQGCDEQIGICYPPLERVIPLVAETSSSTDDVSFFNLFSPENKKDEATDLAVGIETHGLFWTIIIFFLLGVGLSLTPCVLPMIPILLGIISGTKNSSRQHIVFLTFSYISGVCLAFTLFGILAALSGQLLSITFQQPLVITFVAFLFIVLAFSMFGAYDIRLPHFIQNKMGQVGRGGSFVGAFSMGILSAVAVSPCVAPPLIGALLYIGNTGNVALGATALLSLALGMSVLIAVAGISGSTLLPKAGEWMNTIKNFLGVMLLLLAVWISSPLLPIAAQMILYGLLLILSGSLLRPFSISETSNPMGIYAIKTLAMALIIWGITMLIGVSAGSRDILTPLSPFIQQSTLYTKQQDNSTVSSFINVATIEEIEQYTQNTSQPIMLEVYADWCISCKEFERFTLTDKQVIARLAKVTLLRFDVTQNNKQDQRFLKHYGLFGPPAILFYNASGELISDVRVIGFEKPTDFLQSLTYAGI